MISLIAFLLTLAGSINWFCIAVMQYDFVAGLFGSQANLFSRIVYGIIGLSAIWLVYAIIRGKGKIKIDGKRATDRELLGRNKKKKESKNTASVEEKNTPQPNFKNNNSIEENLTKQNQNTQYENPQVLNHAKSEAAPDNAPRDNASQENHNENNNNTESKENEKQLDAMENNSFYNTNENIHTQKINKTDN